MKNSDIQFREGALFTGFQRILESAANQCTDNFDTDLTVILH